ncbi:MAG: glutamate--tRNA ligase family protein [Victivallales bacterium]|nr:glutamate--tRNA ligase family protein [Victivallales bacterium]
MSVKVRFAPSPTGKVHIGNIRTAIFNWLFARHEHGEFVLRVEDTDRERSTREAIDAMLACMDWLGLDYDGEVVYQSDRTPAHLVAARQLLDRNQAYYGTPGADGKAPVLFRIPLNADDLAVVRTAGPAEMTIAPEVPLRIGGHGVEFAIISRKGKPTPAAGCLAGFKDLRVFDRHGNCCFDLREHWDAVLAGEIFTVTDGEKITFTRREVFFNDMIKGELAKPLDSMKDQVIVRSDGTPIFHLANVCDDCFQQITHIVRGDDHVENTYRHILLFHQLGYPVPQYAHLPMIVNKQGKPYSKRDGDAFVGDFRSKGYLADALFNYLTLLGWSPGDDREKMSRDEMIASFNLARVKSAPAQFDLNKLQNMNGAYLAEMPAAAFQEWAAMFARECELPVDPAAPEFAAVAALMQSRTKQAADVGEWRYFFTGDFAYNEKAVRKQLSAEEVRAGLRQFVVALSGVTELTATAAETLIRATEQAAGLAEGKLNQPLRLAVSGITAGADIGSTIARLGVAELPGRINRILSYYETLPTVAEQG